jgi:hypothetical protein
MFGGGAKALVGRGAATRARRGRGFTSSLGSVGSSDSSLKRAAAYSTRSRGWPYVYPCNQSRQQAFFESGDTPLWSSA